MRFILKKFAVNNKITVTFKDSHSEHLGVNANCFIAQRAWSQEFETTISHPIEEAFKDQVNKVLAGKEITDHKAIFDYKMLWAIRHHYANKKIEDKNIYHSEHFGGFSKETEELIESLGKVPIRAGGVLTARFLATHEMKELLELNRKKYDGWKWIALYSPNKKFISADDYKDRNCIPISPTHMLITPIDQKVESQTIDACDTAKYNNESKLLASNFWFGDE